MKLTMYSVITPFWSSARGGSQSKMKEVEVTLIDLSSTGALAGAAVGRIKITVTIVPAQEMQ